MMKPVKGYDDYVLPCKFCGKGMKRTGKIKSNYLGGIYIEWNCEHCNVTDLKPEGFKRDGKMTKNDLIKAVLNDMTYDESIRSGIWKHKTDTYQEFFHHCHSDMLPDDFRYQMIHDILCNMDEDTEEDEIEFLDSLVPIYSEDLLQWVSSNVSRISYCDEYQDEFDGSALKLTEIITGGYFEELQEIYNLITEWLDENTEEE